MIIERQTHTHLSLFIDSYKKCNFYHFYCKERIIELMVVHATSNDVYIMNMIIKISEFHAITIQ